MHVYRVDLTKIDGDGEFLCPRCGITMSPDDEREETYTILGSKATNEGLEEIEICCNKCFSHIHLTGFSLLEKVSDLEEEKTGYQEPNSYITHV